MRLNRERIIAGLGLLLVLFGIYGILGSRMAAPFQPISAQLPVDTQEIPRSEPRLYLGEGGGERNPFQLASDWRPLPPDSLDPPAQEPFRWFLLPLGKGADPSESGFTFLAAPPLEVKADAEDTPKTEGPSGGAAPVPPAPIPPGTVPPAAGSKAQDGPAGGTGAPKAAGGSLKSQGPTSAGRGRS